MQGLHHVYDPSLSPPHPVRKVHIVGHCRTQHDQSNMLRQHNNRLLPHHPSLGIVDVVHLIENDPFDVADHLRTAIELVTQDLGSHDNAGGLRVHRDVACYDTHGVEAAGELAVFLVGKGFDGRSVYDLSLVLDCQCDAVLGDDGLACTGMGSHEDTFFLLEVED